MKVQQSIDINVTPERIWPYFVDPEKVLQWCITFRKFEYTSDQRSGVGTPLYIEEQAGGTLSKMRFAVTEWKENEKLVIRMESGANYKSYVQQFQLDPIPTGSRFTFAEEIVLPMGIIGEIMGFFAEKMSAGTAGKMLLKLKALAEA